MKRGAIIFVLLILSISYLSAAVTFPASNVSIKIDGNDRTLQYAVDNGLLIGNHTYASSASTAIGQHDASQIWVKTDSGELTLLSSLSPVNKLTAPSTPTTSYSGSVPNPGHTAMEIVFSSGKTLQALIDSGSFAQCTPGTTKRCGTDDTCGTYPTVTCTNLGTWQTCNPTYAPFGTACQDDNHACEGSGVCESYYGDGSKNSCDECPWGIWTSDNINYCVSTHWGHQYTGIWQPSDGGTWWSGWRADNFAAECGYWYSCGCNEHCWNYRIWYMKPTA